MDQWVFHSRNEKELFLKEIIKKLHISEPEKDIYMICIDILDDSSFESFFIKITNQLKEKEIYSFESWPLNLIT